MSGARLVPSLQALAQAHECDRERLGPELAAAFVEVPLDASNGAWIEQALADPQSRSKSLLRDIAKGLVGFYDANGLTGAYVMRLLSSSQWASFLGERLAGCRSLLDVGAGDGEVAAELATHFERVVTTETSAPMARRLRARGWVCHEVDLSRRRLPEDDRFDLVSVQNVLDRTSFPLSLIERLRRLMNPRGFLLVTVPVPIRPVVFSGPIAVEPEQRLGTDHDDWESGVRGLYEQVLRPRGLRIEALARAPYLCRGDARAPVTALDDAILLLSVQPVLV